MTNSIVSVLPAKACLQCTLMFTPRRKTQLFHSPKCKDRYHNAEKARMVAEMKHITQGAKL